MEEKNQTRQALDELAELFLTQKSSLGGDAPTESQLEEAASGSEPEDLDGPEPIRLAPKLPPTGSQQRQTPGLRYHPAGAGEGEDQLSAAIAAAIDRAEASRSATADRASAQAVLLSNLPGLSGPWLTQYAQLLAQQDGPVAVLHVEEQRIEMELVEPTDRPLSGRRISRRERPIELLEQLDLLLEAEPTPVRHVLVHVDLADGGAIERLASLESWTILTGADDAALAAVARLLRDLAEHQLNPGQVNLAVLGSDRARGEQAVDKLAPLAAELLDAPLRLAACQRQMMPVHLRQLGRFGPTETLWPQLEARLAELDEPTPALASASDAGPDLASDESVLLEVEPEDDHAEPVQLRADPEPQQSTPEPEREPEPEPEPVRAQAPESETQAQPEPAAPAPIATAGDEVDLARFLTQASGDFGGSVSLEARCPHQPRTQLLLDQNGRLHMLRRDEGDPGRGDLTSLRAAIVDLLEARKWVAEHAQLLQLTQRQCRFDLAAEPVLHLFTDRAELATGLTAKLGDMLRLHMLREIRVGDQATWFCTPLN
ncbi:MAG: hypothetical protein ACLFVN_05270 [Phycisphaeraceae bacterium]